MKKLLFAVRDIKADTFNAPIMCDNVAVAVRNFQDACNSPDLPLVKHPEDYAFYKLGEYDMVTGVIVALDQPLHIASAEEMLRHV